jgi:hypothetical protein
MGVTNQGAASSAPTGPVGSEDSDFEIPYKQKARAVPSGEGTARAFDAIRALRAAA